MLIFSMGLLLNFISLMKMKRLVFASCFVIIFLLGASAQKNTDELAAAVTLAFQRVQKTGLQASMVYQLVIFGYHKIYFRVNWAGSFVQLFLDTNSWTMDGWPSIQLPSQAPDVLTPPVPSFGSTLDDALKRGTIRIVDNPDDGLPW